MSTRDRKVVLYGAFKGMGDFLSAAPVIVSELNSGTDVMLLLFPQIRSFVELLDLGPNRNRLQIFTVPVGSGLKGLKEFFRQMSRLSPDTIWISPHAPAPASSWKIPLLLWTTKKRYWRNAKLAGAESERMSWLFDQRLPVDRRLPFAAREWAAYSAFKGRGAPTFPAKISFKESIRAGKFLPPAYDVLIHPGAGAQNRRWPVEKFADVVRCIPPTQRIAVVGLPGDISAMQKALPTDRGIQFLQGTLEESITAIARARVALTMDSGNMFFAQLLGVPTVALFGASNPINVIPLDENIVAVFEQKWSCQPCGQPNCRQPSVYCMNSIEPSTVAKQILRLLEARSVTPLVN